MNVKDALDLCKSRKGRPLEDDWELMQASDVLSGFLTVLVNRIRKWEGKAFHEDASFSMRKDAHDDMREFLKSMQTIHGI